MLPTASVPQKSSFRGPKERIGTYTDQELDAATGLYNYDARLYDPVVGRFVSPDSIIPNIYNPQSLNRYSYVRNNPLIYTDPSGHVEQGPGVYEYIDIRQAIRNFLTFLKGGAENITAPEPTVPMLDPDQNKRKLDKAVKQTKKIVDTVNEISGAVSNKDENAQGGVDFSKSPDLYPVKEGQSNIVKIKYTGSIRQDYGAANKAGNIGKTQKPPEGYSWHHVGDYDPKTNTGSLQLIKRETHEATYPHKGGISQYEKATGEKYK